MKNSCSKKLAQIGNRGIGIGIGLEIGNIGAGGGTHFPADAGNGKINLSVDGLFRHASCALQRYGEISGTACAAEDTAASSNGAVPIGTGHAAFQSDFIYLGAKTAFHFIIKRVVGFSIPVHI